MDFLELIDNCGVDNVQGTQIPVLAVCRQDIDTWPAVVGSGTAGGTISITGDIVLAAGKAFKSMDMLIQTGELKHVGIGPNGSMGMETSAEFELRNTGAVAAEAAIATINSMGVFVFSQNDGTKRVIGTKDSPAIVTAIEGTEGKDGTQSKTFKITVKTSNNKLAPYYSGALDVTV